MNNMELFDNFRFVPDWAKKPISGGPMNGKTDISPMWRIQVLTEVFGPCGYGWKYVIKNQRLEAAGKEVKAFVDIDLFVKWGESWSEAIPGIGGNSFVSKNGNVSDECFKMALTDAISVAAKALGVAADVYMGYEPTKYTQYDKQQEQQQEQRQEQQQEQDPSSIPAPKQKVRCEECGAMILPYIGRDGRTVCVEKHVNGSKEKYGRVLCLDCIQNKA